MTPDPKRTENFPGSLRLAFRDPLCGIVALLGLILVWVPVQLFSSTSYRGNPNGVAFLTCTIFSWWIFPRFLKAPNRWTWLAIGCLLIAHISSWIGGVQHGTTIGTATLMVLNGLIGVTGLTVMIVVFMQSPWRSIAKRASVLLLVAVLAVSYFSYFLPIEQLIPMGQHTKYFEPTRLVLIWPLRIPLHRSGQIGWEHANHAAYLFAIAMVIVMEYLAARNPKRAWLWWLLAMFLGVAVFLTGSRSAWLMLLFAIPVVWWGRSKKFWLTSIAVILAALVCGIASLQLKKSLITRKAEATQSASSPTPTAPQSSDRDLHLEGLLERKSAGRISAYEIFWRDFERSKRFGRGLEATGKPIAHLMHEHSSFIASVRGGGFVALTAHLLLLGSAGIVGIRLFRKGERWPLVLLVVVLPGLLFDRGNIFIFSGRYEFITHWTAVISPFVVSLGNKVEFSSTD